MSGIVIMHYAMENLSFAHKSLQLFFYFFFNIIFVMLDDRDSSTLFCGTPRNPGMLHLLSIIPA
jgi:hypothetical protein